MTEVASELENMPELVIVSGMSGAGRTEAMHAFEDLGYFCVDNLPSALIGNLLALTGMPGQPDNHRRIAVVCDARSGGFFKSLMEELAKLKSAGVDYRVLFLDADDEKLIARYKSSRRRHPLCTDGSSIANGIEREREMLYDVRKQAHHVINTTDMMPAQLRSTIRALFAPGEERQGLQVTVYSFGFKHGAPVDADLLWMCDSFPIRITIPSCARLPALTSLCATTCFADLKPRSSRSAGARCSIASCPGMWRRANSSSPSPLGAPAVNIEAWRSPSPQENISSRRAIALASRIAT